MAKKKVIGQVNLVSNEVDGIDELVNKPEVVEHDGLRVVKLVIPADKQDVQQYVDTALDIARKMAPEIKSRAKPPWLRSDWQAMRRKRKAGLL